MGSKALTRRYQETELERFWTHVSPEPNTGCWLWTGVLTGGGYGRLGRVRASRLSVEIATGVRVPKHFDVCHRCDFPPCVNPDHLFIGTRVDNMRDAARKGRAKKIPQRGEENGQAVLTEVDVLEIRRLYSAGMSSPGIAARMGRRRVTVYRAATGRSWGHLPL